MGLSSMVVRRLVIASLLFGSTLAATRARADTTLRTEIGWGGRTRSGRWTPIFVTVADPKPRNAVIELYAPHDATQAARIRLPVAVGPSEQMYVLYAPLLNSGEPTRVSLVDASNFKLLKDATVVDAFGNTSEFGIQNTFVMEDGPFIGVSGRGPALATLEQGNNSPKVAYIEASRLPWTFRGYDALDLLVLNQPDLATMPFEQQAAIRDWVEAGGRLVLWPGENPLPPRGPLVDLLPGKVGDLVTVALSKSQLEIAGLSDRFGKFTARAVTAEPGAVVDHPFGNHPGPDAVAITAYRGLGKVTLVNFNVSALLFDSTDKQKTFFRSFLDLSTRDGMTSGNQFEVHPLSQSQAAAQLMDLMGDVPGVGRFGFGYVALVMLGMMAIVGPIDWFVLKWMRRQPWTWATTAGWIGLITAIALSLGTLLRSGELHFRTVSIIDQVADQAVARADAIGLYSPRSTDYQFSVRPASWWEPMSADQFSYSREVMRGIPFRQGENENVPLEDTVRVWNLRFLVGESQAKGDPIIAADLSLTPSKPLPVATTRAAPFPRKPQREPAHVQGTIRNVSDGTLPNLWLRTKLGVYDLSKQPGFPAGGLAAGATLTIDLPLLTRGDGFEVWQVNPTAPPYPGYAPYQSLPHANDGTSSPLAIVKAAGALPADREHQIEQRLAANDEGTAWAVVYAESEPAEGAAKLVDQQPKTRNWQVVRALVPLKESAAPQPTSAPR